MSKQDRRYLTMAVLGVAAITAALTAGVMLVMGIWWPWPVATFCGGWAVGAIYRMGIETGREDADNAT